VSDQAPAIVGIAALAIDCHNPPELANWWSRLLGGSVEVDDDGDATLHTPVGLAIDFLRVPGGGLGHTMRKLGLTVDNLRSVDLVTADGDSLHVDAWTEPELFWGLRGGGGNFGIATTFEYRLHPVGPILLAGPIFWPLADAPRSCGSCATTARRRPTSSAWCCSRAWPRPGRWCRPSTTAGRSLG
jgi:hypothetical protein